MKKEIANCIFVVIAAAVFFFAMLGNIKEYDNLKFFIASFAYFITCFSIRNFVFFLIDRKGKEK